jgi:hypothetical protein
VGTGAGRLIIDVDEHGEQVERDVHCTFCGVDDGPMTIYDFPDIPLMAVCIVCDKKES